MTELRIYKPNGELWDIVPVTESAKWERELMKRDEITLGWTATESVLIPMGSYIEHPYVRGSRYYILEPYYPQARDRVEYSYQPVFQHELMILSKMPFMLHTYNDGVLVSSESDWNFTGMGSTLMPTLEDAIREAIGVEYDIQVDKSIEASLSLSFSNVDILTAINNIANVWQCEWWTDEQINGDASVKTIYFGTKCIHGEQYSLISGGNIEAPNSNQKATYYNRFFIFGSNRNISQDYEGSQVSSVVNKRLTLDPQRFPKGYIDLPRYNQDGEATWNEAEGRYETDLTDADMRFSKVLYFDDIYPHSNCIVKNVDAVQRYVLDSNTGDKIQLANGSYDSWYLYVITLEYTDSTGAKKQFKLNNWTYGTKTDKEKQGSLLKGEVVKIVFKNGALQGREFDITYHSEDKTFESEDKSHSFVAHDGAFELIKKEDNTIILPNRNVLPKVGDEVIVFNIRMPDTYYVDAYRELEEKAIAEIYEETKDGNEYSVNSNPVEFANNQPGLTLGRSILLEVGGRTIDTRVTKLSSHIDRPFEVNITLSKALAKGTISTLVTTIASTEQKVVEVSVTDTTQIKLSKQQFYNAIKESKDAMFDTDGYFKEPISPVTIDTMMLSVGSTSTNFQLEDILFQPNYNSSCNRVYVAAGKLIHYGINIGSEYDEEGHLITTGEPKIWNLSGGEIEWYNNGVKTTSPTESALYYIYAECSKTGQGGKFILDTKQRKYNDFEGFYYFLVGTISSATTQNGYKSRILSTTYGSTQINGRMVRTGRIQSVDGKTWFDLDRGVIHGNITFTGDDGQETDISKYVSSVAQTEVEKAIGGDIDEKIQAEVDKKLDELTIEVGGRNLLNNSTGNKGATAPWVAKASSSGTTFAIVNGYNGQKGVRINVTTQNARKFIGYDSETSFVNRIAELEVGNSVAVSAWIYINSIGGTNAIEYFLRIYYTSTSYDNYSVGVVRTADVGKWVKLEKTFVIKHKKNGTAQLVFAPNANDTYDFIVSCLKLERGNIVTDWTPSQEDVDSNITDANTAASNAKTAADNAQASANTANATLSDYASDSKIVATEKEGLKQQLTDIKSEYGDITAQATKFGVSATAYTTAYNNVKTSLEYFCAISSGAPSWGTTIDISSGTPKTYYGYISAYYTARQTILNQITTEAVDKTTAANLAKSEAETIANSIQIGGRNLLKDTSTAKALVIYKTSKGVKYYNYTSYAQNVVKNAKVGDEFIMSFDANSEIACTLGFNFTNGTAGGNWSNTLSDVNITSGVGHYVMKGKIKQVLGVTTTNPCFYCRNTSAADETKKCTISNIKLEIGNKATEWTIAPEDIDDSVAEAYEKAQTAADNASTALANAKTATDELDKMNNDGFISPTEKTALRQQLADIESEYEDIIKQADAYSVSKTAYTTAYTAAKTALTKYSASTPSHIAVGSDYANIAAYYTARQTLLNAITTAAKAYVGTSVTNAVTNMVIGATNLYYNTATFGGQWRGNINAAFTSTSYVNPTIDAQTLHGNKVASVSGAWLGYGQDFDCEPNTEYTISQWVKSSSGTLTFYCYYNDDGRSTYTSGSAISVGTSWKKVTYTFKTTATATKARVLLECTTGTKWYIAEIKVEKGNKATDWSPSPKDIDAAISQAEQNAIDWNNYVNNSIKQGGTEVNGGLVLTDIIGLGDMTPSGEKGVTINSLTCGMNGSKPNSNENVLRIWAGSKGKTFDGAATAPFRVYDNGHVDAEDISINSKDDVGNHAEINNGQFAIVDKNGAIKTIVSQYSPSSITEATTGAEQQDANIGTSSTESRDNHTSIVLVNGEASYTYPPLSNPSTLNLATLIASAEGGVLKVPSLTIALTERLDKPSSGSIGVTTIYKLRVGNVSKTKTTTRSLSSTSSGDIYDTETITFDAFELAVEKGRGYTLQLSSESSVSVIDRTKPSGTSVSVPISSTKFGVSGSYKMVISYDIYINRILGNGFMFGNGGERYFAFINSVATSAEMMRLRQANYILRLQNQMLQYKAASSASFYNANPLFLVFRVYVNGSTITCTTMYNPKGYTITSSSASATNIKCSKLATGRYKFEHVFGLGEDYYVQAMPMPSTRIVVYDSYPTETSFALRTDNSSGTATDVTYMWISVYDCKSY